jgi:hypothetical protein
MPGEVCMHRKLLLIAFALVTFAAGITIFAGWRKVYNRIYPPKYFSLRGQAQRALDEGTTKIENNVTTCFSHMQSFADGLRRYSLVVARPVAQEVMANPEERSSATWYKLQLLETLIPGKESSGLSPVAKGQLPPGIIESLSSPKDSSGKSLSPDLPNTLLPLANNEVVMSIPGGVVIVDGVEISTWYRGYRHYKTEGDTYLLFIENGAQPGVVELKRQFNDTVVKIIDGDRLEVRGGTSVDGSDEKELQDQLTKYCGSSLAQLREELPFLNQAK